MIRFSFHALVFAWFYCGAASAGELYYTGFESFPVGNNTIAGTDGWTGSASHLTLNLSGVDSEADHLVAGIGNAGFIGGNSAVLTPGTSTTVNVRRAINVDPVALDQEILQFYVNCGISDSSPSGGATRRDNFEFAFYNQSGQLLGFVQFDNSSINVTTGQPYQRILRSNYTGNSFTKVSTGAIFFYNLLMQFGVRINFRTNRWTASLDGVELFSDEVFYSGPNTRNMGVMAVQMQIVSTALYQGTGQMGPAPGNNYMLFDDFGLRIDPLPPVEILDFQRDPLNGAVRLRWLTEALYRYQVLYSDNLTTWNSDLPASTITASSTGQSPVFTDFTAAPRARRYYQLVRSLP